MPTNARIALHHPGENDISLEDVVLPDPVGHQVLIRLESTGVCRSQLTEMRLHTDGGPLPLGHEGIGVIEATGSDVSVYTPGDRVVISWVPLAGEGIRPDSGTTVILSDGTPTKETRVFTWASHTLVDENYLIPLEPTDTDPALSLMGCAMITGVGSALYAGRTKFGDNVVVIGAGGVGLAAIIGAVAAGASQIAVIDVDDSKLDFARQFGATHTINSTKEDPVAVVRSIMARLGTEGADVVIDCVGADATVTTAIDSARPALLGAGAGGTVVIAGLGFGTLNLNATNLVLEQKSIVGTLAGGSGRAEILQTLRAVRSGRIDISRMVTETFSLTNLNTAIDRLRTGQIRGRGIVAFTV